MNTDSNLHFQIAGPGPTAFKLWKEAIALRILLWIFLLWSCSPPAELAGENVSVPWVA